MRQNKQSILSNDVSQMITSHIGQQKPNNMNRLNVPAFRAVSSIMETAVMGFVIFWPTTYSYN